MPVKAEYRRTLTLEDLGFSADVTLTTGKWNEVADYVIPAGVRMALGQRSDGYLSMILKFTDDSQFHGKVRIVARDPREYKTVCLREFHTRNIGDLADKTQKLFQPLQMPWIPQDYHVAVEIDPESSTTLDYGNTTSAFDFTEQLVK